MKPYKPKHKTIPEVIQALYETQIIMSFCTCNTAKTKKMKDFFQTLFDITTKERIELVKELIWWLRSDLK